MKLTPREKDKMFVSLAAIVARNRLSRGVKLNYPEAIAIITDFVIEGARDGKSVAELIASGTAIRFEPGQSRDIELIEIQGERKIFGFNKKVMGSIK